MWRTGKRSLRPATGIDGTFQTGMTKLIGCLTRNGLFCVGLFIGSCRGEAGQRAAASLDARERRISIEWDVHPTRVRELRHEAAVGEGRRVAMAEFARGAIARELRLQRAQAQIDPVPVP